MLKMRWRPGLRPGLRWGSSRRSHRPLVGWRGGTPPQTQPPRRLQRLSPRACCARFSTRAIPLFETFRRPCNQEEQVLVRTDSGAVF